MSTFLTVVFYVFQLFGSSQKKFNKPLSRIHKPVKTYDPKVTRSVQRMFNNLQTNKPLWRANWYLYQDPELFSPLSEEFSHTTNKEFFDGDFLGKSRKTNINEVT